MTQPESPEQFQGIKRPKGGQWPNSWKSPPLPPHGWNNPPTHCCSLFSHSVVSNSLWSHGLQYTRFPCPLPSPGACSNSCPLSQWRHPTMSSSVMAFTRLQSFPVSGSFLMSGLFTSGGQSTGASAIVLPMNIQDWFPLGWTGLISLLSKGDSKETSPTPQLKNINSLVLSFLYTPTLTCIHDYWKKHGFD